MGQLVIVQAREPAGSPTHEVTGIIGRSRASHSVHSETKRQRNFFRLPTLPLCMRVYKMLNEAGKTDQGCPVEDEEEDEDDEDDEDVARRPDMPI